MFLCKMKCLFTMTPGGSICSSMRVLWQIIFMFDSYLLTLETYVVGAGKKKTYVVHFVLVTTFITWLYLYYFMVLVYN